MEITPPMTTPPFRCIFCGETGQFSSEEHIVPNSLGNDILVLAPGWVCDRCNNICSGFESKALNSSILGVERCLLGTITKKQRPARSDVHGISWFSEPGHPANVVSAEARWDRIPMLLSPDARSGKLAFPVHDDSCYALARLLLKMGVEIISPSMLGTPDGFNRFRRASDHVLRADGGPWPYFIIRSESVDGQLVSVLDALPTEHEYIQSCGFDIFLHEIEEDIIFFFRYGKFRAGICLSSRETDWRQVLVDWGVPHVGCPVEFSEQSA